MDRQWMTFHCEKCNTVLGDGLSVCGEVKSINCIVLLKVTKDIVINDKKETGQKGDLAHCIYSVLSCRCCRSVVGRIIVSSSAQFSNYRSLFLLQKSKINCYLLDSTSLVKATSMSFDVKPLVESMKEMMLKFETIKSRITYVKQELANSTFSSC
uniref:Protein yippee-like n=1 Tax=Knipowitschia caucasica TaxID=637954 RepID=A0AAV2JGF8_KNICA